MRDIETEQNPARPQTAGALAIVRRGELNQNVAAWAATLDMVADSDLNFRAAK